MKIKVKRNMKVSGIECEVGAVVDATDKDAAYLIASGRAEIVEAKAQKPEVKKEAEKKK